MRAALALDAARLDIASMTVQEMANGMPAAVAPAGNELRHALTHAALFLTDAVVSALAFDAPEIMDLQGTWAAEFMPAHHVSMDALHRFFALYVEGCAQRVSNEDVPLIRALVMRLVTAVQAPANQEHIQGLE
jgi:hypothetical protein